MPDPAGPAGGQGRPIGPAEGLHRQSIRLSALAQGVDSTTAAHLALGEQEMRRDLAKGILKVFVVGNAAVWLLVVALLVIDVVMVSNGLARPADRIIDQGVVKTLVGATTVQVGILVVVIARSLFRL
jgi:putative copper export protein